ncbi:hypothetical protein [Mycolicibacterium llatzerense]|uniref:hypothetical protein n=1 Tax=Mycolicibacterium llatzerense TaxID=280871 RepID=UPI0013A6CDFE|nr:hypothetical protein [Mycolicibacterium llatzerense]
MPRPNKQLSAAEYTALRQRFSADDANYHLLNGFHPVFGRRGVWDGDYARQHYLRSVDHLIGVLDGSIAGREVPEPDRPESHRPDIVVWLDKSARPASWFVDAFWDLIATPDSIRPRYEFLRIDRRDWLGHMGYDDARARNAAPKDVRIGDIPEDPIQRIRALFCVEPIDPDNWREQAAKAATTLDDLNVLVVDETMVSGATLQVATGLLARVAPTARVSGTYFWRDTTSRTVSGAIQPGTVPIWYPGETTTGEEITVYGRGIGNSSAAYWDQLPDDEQVIRNRIAAFVVSAPHHNPETFEHLPDELADQLKADIAQLVDDYQAGKVLRRPTIHRSDDDFDRILDDQNISLEDFVALNDRWADETRKRIIR